MRRVIIQIFSLYFAVFYTVAGYFLRGYPVALYLMISGVLNLIVAIKVNKFKARTNMLYNSLFLYLSFLVNYFMIHNFLKINQDLMTLYIYKTIPELLKSSFLLINLAIVFLALLEFNNSKTMD
ncbi:MAG: hypothetical protein WAV55_12995 [Clostridiaceae bacterium]